MQEHKAIRAAELLRQHCRERSCNDCIFWGKDFPRCRLSDVRSPGHFPVEDIRKDMKNKEE